MKVYIVLDNCSFCGVYKTRLEAESRIKELILQFSINEEDLYIEEYEV